MESYRAPLWLPGGHAQTIWAARFSRRFTGEPPRFARERWTTPDGDFIDVDIQPGPPGVTDPRWLVVFHGLEGSSDSQYIQAFAFAARSAGLAFAAPHFRGCSGELNLAPRTYHSGDFEEVAWILARLRKRATAPLLTAGVSLGGNALLRWAEEAGDSASRTAASVAAICSPIDLAAGGRAIGRGLNRQIYNRMFLASMKPRALAKWAQHPGLFDRERLLAARDLYEFDNIFTAPLHGFKDTEDYWARGSAKPHLHRIRIPALVLNARNDPFVPASSLPTQQEVGDRVTLWQPAHGGHVGFPAGAPPGYVMTMPQAVLGWLRDHA
ncbi:MAG: alpha/beta fold hydrolase [Burkholderiaceae bacterium]|nr:alpha/beta fold hydrolase [Burkholderiaceae bacterium]